METHYSLFISHYALNVGLVREDSVYDEVKDDSVDFNLVIGDDQKLTQKQVCELVDQSIMSVKTSFNQTTSQEGKAINRLELGSVVVQGNTAVVRVKWSISFGKLFSIAKMNAGPNVNMYYFADPIPWLSKETFTGGDPSITQADFVRVKPQTKYYARVLLGITGTPTTSQMNDTWNILPSGKAAHQRLSNKNIFWPDPLLQLAGGYTFYMTGYKPVKTPSTWSGGNDVTVLNMVVSATELTNPLKETITTVAVDCSNPLAPGGGVNGNSGHMVPSKLLGWYDTEFNYGLQSVRKVPVIAMNYFWLKKADLVTLGQARVQTLMTSNMNVLKSGYFALVDYATVNNQIMTGGCLYPTCGTVCLHTTEYNNRLKFAHYTTQKKTPIELQIYF